MGHTLAPDDQQTRPTETLSTAASPAAKVKQKPDLSELRGRVLAGRYELDSEVGEGGFGVVFAARDRRLGKRVAIKVLSPSVAVKPKHLTRFKQEASAAARIGHKNIVDVTDFDEDEDGTLFMVMEFIDGRDLRRVNREDGPLPLPRALSIAAQIADALSAAHENKIIHRDLKPANVILTTVGPVADFVKVLDFGVSKITGAGESSDSDTLTEAGHVLGTPKYMSPEQGMGQKDIDGRADVYALGTMLYEMLTHRVPYSGATSYEIIHKKVSHDPLPPSVVKSDFEYPLEIDRLILKALHRDVNQRFPTMLAFEHAIRDLLETVDPAAAAVVSSNPRTGEMREPGLHSASTATLATKVEGAAVRRSPERRRSPWLIPGIAAAVVAAAAAVIAVVPGGSKDERPPAPQPAVQAPSVDARPASKPAAPTVSLRLAIEPADATVEVDGVAVTDNPLQLPKSDRVYELRVSAPGFVAQEREIRAVTDGDVEVTLQPERKPSKKPSRRRPRLPDSPL